LITQHEVVSVPSASVLAGLRRETTGRKVADKTVAVLADPVFDKSDDRVAQSSRPARDPIAKVGDLHHESDARRAVREVDLSSGGGDIPRLPFSREEAEAIVAAAPAGKGMKAIGFRASRVTAIGAELAQYRIVHFATHALLNNEHPELSGIVLSLVDEQGRPQDGFLRLHEIYNLNLPVELVVLSACQSGLGKDVKGEGLVGLVRGFMYAGASRVVASRWKVNDWATAELMKQFYTRMLKDGMRPAAALRAAQVAMWKQKRWQAPYYWAGFVLHGEWR
jgi:CHAT domain-containing protein